VLYREGDLLEWRRITGGTAMVEVFKVEPHQVTLIYREGEAYDETKRIGLPSNIEQVILKGPIAAGITWTSGDVHVTIISTSEQVQAVGQTLTGSRGPRARGRVQGPVRSGFADCETTSGCNFYPNFWARPIWTRFWPNSPPKQGAWKQLDQSMSPSRVQT